MRLVRVATGEARPFSALPAELQEKALEKNIDCNVQDSFWYECIFDYAKEVARIIGIQIENIYFSGFWSQGDGACFTGTYRYRKGALAEIKKYAPLDRELHGIAERLQNIQRRAFYGIYASIEHRGHYYHSGCMRVEMECERPFDEEGIKENLRWFADWIYSQLEKEYEYQTGEGLREYFTDSDILFDEDGDMV